jgi:hypothetical protein
MTQPGPETWLRDRRAALGEFLAVSIAHSGDPFIVLTPGELNRLRPLVAAARSAGVCLQCDPEFPEVWYPIGTRPHLASSHGHVRSSRRILTQRDMNRPPGDGPKYQQCDLVAGGQKETKPVHQCLLMAFEGGRPPGHESCHGDDVPDHNHWCNLRWGVDNELDKPKAVRVAAARKARAAQLPVHAPSRKPKRDRLHRVAATVRDYFRLTYNRRSEHLSQSVSEPVTNRKPGGWLSAVGAASDSPEPVTERDQKRGRWV